MSNKEWQPACSKSLDETSGMKKLMDFMETKYPKDKIEEYSKKCQLTPQTFIRRTLINRFFY